MLQQQAFIDQPSGAKMASVARPGLPYGPRWTRAVYHVTTHLLTFAEHARHAVVQLFSFFIETDVRLALIVFDAAELTQLRRVYV